MESKRDRNLQVLVVLNGAVKKFFNFFMERSQPKFLLSVREVYALVSTRGYNVEFGIKYIDTMNNSVEARESESSVALVLSNSILAEIVEQYMLDAIEESFTIIIIRGDIISPSSNLLECAGDDEICMVHGKKISCKLA